MSTDASLARDIALLAARDHHEPHRVLGAHPRPRRRGGAGLAARTRRPCACCPTAASRSMLPHRDSGLFEGLAARARRLPRLRGRGGVRGHALARPRPVLVPADARRARPAPGRARAATRSSGSASARTRARSTASPGVAFAVWAPSARSVSVVGDFNGWDGRLHPMRSLGSSGVWELFVPGVGAGRALQVRGPRRRRQPAPEGRPDGAAPPRCRRSTASTVFASQHPLARRGVDGAPARSAGRTPSRCRSTRCTCRSWRLEPRRGQPLAHLPRARRRARRLRARHGLHPRRAAAGDGAPVRGLVGLPGDLATSRRRRASARPTTCAR